MGLGFGAQEGGQRGQGWMVGCGDADAGCMLCLGEGEGGREISLSCQMV